MNIKMAKGTQLREHILKIFDHLNTLEILDGEIYGESQIILSLNHYLTLLINLRSIII